MPVSLPDACHSPSVELRPRLVRRPLATLLDAASEHRLHPALLLVGVFRVPPSFIVDLTWPQVCLPPVEHAAPGRLLVNDAIAELLHVHGCRQRLDRFHSGASWPAAPQVFLDEQGHPYSDARADAVVTEYAAQVGLPPLTLSALRHPCFTA